MFNKHITIAMAAFSILILLSACHPANNHKDADGGTTLPSANETNQPTNKTPKEHTEKPQDTSPANGVDQKMVLPDKALQKGDSGDAVRILQTCLTDIGYDISITEEYDPDTIWAITDLQLQQEELEVTGIYNQATKSVLEKASTQTIKIKPGKGLPYQTEVKVEGNTEITNNPYEILVLVNKQHALPADFIPDDLVVPNVRFPFTEDLPKKLMRKPAAAALEKMFQAADKEGLTIFAQSGYRSYDRQQAIFAANVARNGEEAANKYSARPGESEHQSGLTMDVTSADVKFDLTIEFGETPEGKWLKEHASAYGFIIRYPLGKEDITEYQYEPWHLRYVGTKAAKEIMSKGITFEEYLGVK